MIGAPYWQALTGRARARLAGPALAGPAQAGPGPEPEHADGSSTPLPAGDTLRLRPGDASLLERCGGPTLDVGSGPGRLTVALAERGVPALGIDVTPQAVRLAQSAGALALQRDVFSRVPGTGRWMFVLLAEGSIGIGGDPVALLSRVAELLAPSGQTIVEVQPPGLSADQLAGMAGEAGLSKAETWSSDGRWFVTLSKGRV